MKKTLIINIGNSIIHIEEDAYEILTTYLNEIKMHFTKNADDFEIVTDIENRIAEMFAEILAAGQKQVIELADVEGVMGVIGGRFAVAQRIEGKAQPKAGQRKIGTGVPGSVELKLQEVVIELNAAGQVGDGEGQVVEAAQHDSYRPLKPCGRT